MPGRDDWRPTATRETLVVRAAILALVRGWFARRGVLEVETPILSRSLVADRHVDCFDLDGGDGPRWLMPSPEGAMKRLLAAGSGDIYQIARSFRRGEAGAQHNPEFTLVEWYRIGRSLHEMIEEVTEFVSEVLEAEFPNPQRHRYHNLLSTVLTLDAREAPLEEIRIALREWDVEAPDAADRAELLDLAMGAVVAPQLGREGPEFVTHFPLEQSALAAADPSDPAIALRFECYLGGRELANGYLELTDAAEQAERLHADRKRRVSSGQALRPVDERLLAALEAGVPACAGVALGFDRLLMHQLGVDDIREVLAFAWEGA